MVVLLVPVLAVVVFLFSHPGYSVLYHDSTHPPDGANVQPDEVRGGEGVEGRRNPHQVCLLVPDPVEQPNFSSINERSKLNYVILMLGFPAFRQVVF